MKVFAPVRPLDVRSLAGPVVAVDVPAGTELVREHEPLGKFFVVLHGSLLLVREGREIEALGSGDCFGEIDPRFCEPQGYSVVTTTPARLLTFSAFGIDRLCESIPGVRSRILEQLPARTGELHSLDAARARAAAAV
jgi:CRP-like cAMP-binding protein